MLAEAGDTEEASTPVAIETSRGLLVAAGAVGGVAGEPEVSRHLAWMGAEVIVVPTLTPTSDRPQELVLTQANAIANQVFVVSVNGAAPYGTGRSLIVDPEGLVRHQAGEGATVISDVLDLDAVTRVRRYGTAGLNRMWQQFRDGDQALELPLYGGRIDSTTWRCRGRRAQSHFRNGVVRERTPALTRLMQPTAGGHRENGSAGSWMKKRDAGAGCDRGVSAGGVAFVRVARAPVGQGVDDAPPPCRPGSSPPTSLRQVVRAGGRAAVRRGRRRRTGGGHHLRFEHLHPYRGGRTSRARAKGVGGPQRHKSVVASLILAGVEPVWLWPRWDHDEIAHPAIVDVGPGGTRPE